MSFLEFQALPREERVQMYAFALVEMTPKDKAEEMAQAEIRRINDEKLRRARERRQNGGAS